MGLVAFLYNKLSRSGTTQTAEGNLYDLQMKDIEGNIVDFNIFKEKKLLIVNTASKCGYTPQYSELEKLHKEHGNRITVLGFPANNFLWQEPGSDQEIATFCQKNYGVTFKMFSKVSVKGKDQHPLYQWLQGKTGKTPSWNFCKYLVNEDGNEVKFYSSDTHPLDSKILNEISK
jgi:glutathione peroxidase